LEQDRLLIRVKLPYAFFAIHNLSTYGLFENIFKALSVMVGAGKTFDLEGVFHRLF